MRRLLLLAVLLTSLSCLSFAAPIVLPLDGGWQTFSWQGLGPISNPADGYSLTTAVPSTVKVVDCCITGDAFDVYLEGILKLSTPSVAGGTQSGAFDGDAAWAYAGLSKGLFYVQPGSYIITISTRELAPGYSSGDGYISADSGVPEPSTWVLLGAGLLGLLGVARRRTA